jgi:hypothetical protein
MPMVVENAVLANGLGSANGLLLGAGVILLVGGIWSLMKRQAGPMGWLGVVAGLALAVTGFVLALVPSGPDATVSFVEPRPGSEVAANEPVTVRVRVDGGELATSPTDPEGGHLHLYVDGRLQQMPYSTTAEIVLPSGEHRLRVEYVDNQHLSYDPEIATSVEVVAG